MAYFALVSACLALAVAEVASPVGKVISLLEGMETNIVAEGKAEDKKIAEYSALCEKRKADLSYQIKTAKTDIDELSARISKAESKAEAATSTIQETQEGIATDEADLKAATEVRGKESADFKKAEQELLDATDDTGLLKYGYLKDPDTHNPVSLNGKDVSATVERAMSVLEKEPIPGRGDQGQPPPQRAERAPSCKSKVPEPSVPGLLKAIQAMMDASMIGHQDAKTLTALVQDSDEQPEPAAYKAKSGGITEMLEDMLDKSKEEVTELRKKEAEAKHSFEMLAQSLQDQVKFAQQALEKAQKTQAEQSRMKADAAKDLEQTQGSLAEDEKTLGDFTLDCKSEAQ
ncbi:unnamed protein product [Effrenium voratum]|nr:unnamed protein product [Effrenium voratum]